MLATLMLVTTFGWADAQMPTTKNIERQMVLLRKTPSVENLI